MATNTDETNQVRAKQLLHEISELTAREQSLPRSLISAPVDKFFQAAGLGRLTNKFARALGREEVVDVDAKQGLDQKIQDSQTQLDSLLALGLPAKSQQDVMEALGYEYSSSTFDGIKALDVIEDIQRSDYEGSRGHGKKVSCGYFSAHSKNLGDVLLYRGAFKSYEQAKIVNFLETLTEDARDLFPEIHGTYVDDGVTYLVMEKLSSRQNQETLSSQEFLNECGGLFQESFKESIEKYGLDQGRATIEYDYLFRNDDGKIRLGIPYRALEFTMEAKSRMLSDQAFKSNEGLPQISSAPQFG